MRSSKILTEMLLVFEDYKRALFGTTLADLRQTATFSAIPGTPTGGEICRASGGSGGYYPPVLQLGVWGARAARAPSYYRLYHRGGACEGGFLPAITRIVSLSQTR